MASTSLVSWLTDADIDDAIRANDRILIDFCAAWCPPCVRMEPILDAVARDYAGRLVVAKVDADRAPQAMQRHGVLGLPTMLLVEKGRVLDRITGFTPEPQLRARIEAAFRG